MVQKSEWTWCKNPDGYVNSSLLFLSSISSCTQVGLRTLCRLNLGTTGIRRCLVVQLECTQQYLLLSCIGEKQTFLVKQSTSENYGTQCLPPCFMKFTPRIGKIYPEGVNLPPVENPCLKQNTSYQTFYELCLRCLSIA